MTNLGIFLSSCVYRIAEHAHVFRDFDNDGEILSFLSRCIHNVKCIEKEWSYVMNISSPSPFVLNSLDRLVCALFLIRRVL